MADITAEAALLTPRAASSIHPKMRRSGVHWRYIPGVNTGGVGAVRQLTGPDVGVR